MPFVHIHAMAQVEVVPQHFFNTTGIAGIYQQRHQYITDGVAGRAGKTTGNIGNTIMYHIVFAESGFLVRGNFAGFKTAAAVYTYIDNYTAGAHGGYHIFGDHNGATAQLSLLRAPTATSQVFNCLASILGSITLVQYPHTQDYFRAVLDCKYYYQTLLPKRP